MKRPEDWRVAYVRALAAESGDRARDRAGWRKAVAWGVGSGLFGYALLAITGLA